LSVYGLFGIPSQPPATESSCIFCLDVSEKYRTIFIPGNCAQQPYPVDKNHLAPPSGYQSKPGRTPSHPLLVHVPPPGNRQMGISLGGNLTSASKSESDVIILIR
jgi:hypothetical protein